MAMLSDIVLVKLRERGFKDTAFNNPHNIDHWHQVAKQPISFFYSTKKEIIMRELDRLQISYKKSQTKAELHQLLCDAETEYYKIICKSSGMKECIFPVHKDVTALQLLHKYSQAIGVDLVSLTCDGITVDLGIKVSDLASVWQASHTGIERNILTLDFQ